MKRPFVVGDKVRKFGVSGQATSFHVDGFIKRIYLDGTIELDCGNPLAREIAHPKQCRRLIKKPRRRVWIDGGVFQTVKRGDSLYSQGVFLMYPVGCDNEPIEFIEVRKPK